MNGSITLLIMSLLFVSQAFAKRVNCIEFGSEKLYHHFIPMEKPEGLVAKYELKIINLNPENCPARTFEGITLRISENFQISENLSSFSLDSGEEISLTYNITAEAGAQWDDMLYVGISVPNTFGSNGSLYYNDDTPLAPTMLSVEKVKGKLALKINDLSSDLTNNRLSHYIIFRDGEIISESSTGLYIEEANLQRGTTYRYSVIAVDSTGNYSPESQEVLFTK